jgi:hypothetical protein
MPRRLLSLLALLLLVLAAQAVADRGGHDGKRGWESRGADDREDDDEDERDEGQGSDRDEDDGRDDDGRDGDRRDGDGDEDREDRKVRGEAKMPRWPGRGEATIPMPARDAAVQVLPTVLPGRIQFSFLVTAGAPHDASVLEADLPAAAWTLSGPAAEACDLDGLRLRCAFAGMAAGEVQLVQVSAPVARAPPWEMVAQASVSTDGGAADAVPGNDAAAGRIGVLLV